jgi:hypothetical protein
VNTVKAGADDESAASLLSGRTTVWRPDRMIVASVTGAAPCIDAEAGNRFG